MKIVNQGEDTYGNLGPYHGLQIIAGESNYHEYQDIFIGFSSRLNYLGSVYQNSISSVNYYTVSDQRLKTGITETKYGLETIKNIQVKDYFYKGDTKNLQTGFIAQQLYENYPPAVKVGGDDVKSDPWQVAYGALTPVLVKAMQEQQKQIETKDVAIADLQSTVAQLQKQVTALVQKFDALDSRQQACCTAASLVPSKTTATEQTTSLSSASLDQNIPNPPVNHATRIGYNIPKGASKAEMIITDNYGKQLKAINLSVMGKGNMNVDTRGLAPGTYSYTLLVDGKMIDTKQMVVAGN